MVLPHYCAVCLKEMYFNWTAYIFLYKYITCFPWMYFITIQRADLPDLVLHFSLFPNNFSLIWDFIKLLCTHDFSRVTFATELSTKLVYKSIFVIDYNYIHLLFFFTVKLSIFSRLCVVCKTQKIDEQVNTHWDIEILRWFKKTVLYRIDIGIARYSEFLVSDRYRFWKSGIEPSLIQISEFW